MRSGFLMRYPCLTVWGPNELSRLYPRPSPKARRVISQRLRTIQGVVLKTLYHHDEQ